MVIFKKLPVQELVADRHFLRQGECAVDYEKLSMLLMDALEEICYVSDPETYDLLYLNQAGRRSFQLPDDPDCIRGRKCYEVMQGMDAPCDFCTNHRLREGVFYHWQYYNEALHKYYGFRDTLIEIDGKKVRVGICKDITEERLQVERLKRRLFLEETVMRCIQILTEEPDIGASMRQLLKVICDYYHGIRAYMFEIDSEAGTIGDAYEWCREGVPSGQKKLKEVPIELLFNWIDRLFKNGEYYIQDLNAVMKQLDCEISGLAPIGPDRLIALPMIKDGKIVGFIGVDNPMECTEDVMLLRSVTFFILEERDKSRLLSELERMSYRDALTGTGNRNRYLQVLKKLKEHPMEQVGIVYADVNGLKKANDTYGHEFGDLVIKRAAESLEQFFQGEVYRVGGDEFVAVCIGKPLEAFEKLVAELRLYVKRFRDFGISVGSSWKQDSLDIICQVKEADAQMYQEKKKYHQCPSLHP